MRVSFGVAVLAAAILSGAVRAAPRCFTPAEAEAAHLRALQQQFTVAALNCRTSDPSDPTFAAQYNKFIERFAAQMRSNGEILFRHFGKGGRELDRWITRIANDAGHRVISQPDFCQQAWDRLDTMITLSVPEMQAYAVKTEAAGDFAPLCADTKPAAGKAKAPSN